MEIVKKNILSIVCGAVALLAVIAYFYPVDGRLYSTFQSTLNDRKTDYDKAHRLVIQDRKMPNLGGQPQIKDEWFPNKDLIQYVHGKVLDYAAASNKVVENAQAYNQQDHYLIEPSALPHPTDNSAGFRFRDQYNEVMRVGGKPNLVDPRYPKMGPLNLPDGVLQSAPPASAQEIQDALKKLWDDKYQMRIIVSNGTSNQKDVEDIFKKDTVNFATEFHRDRARQHKIYMDPDAIIRVPTITPNSTPSASEIWYGQMCYWVELDVCSAIERINENVKDGVTQSPVKNLLEVSLAPNIGMYVTAQPGGVGAAGAAGPQPPPSAPSFTRSPTGRICNTLYDVVEFHVSLIVETRYVKDLLESLRYGKFITITRLESEAVDNRVAEEQGYVYGSTPCVQLTLDGEELFMHGWTVGTQATDKDTQSSGPMPSEVQKLLGITAPLAPAANGDSQGKVAMTP